MCIVGFSLDSVVVQSFSCKIFRCLTPIILSVIGCITLSTFFGDLHAKVPFELSKANPIEESWRWHELEALRGNVLYCGMEDEKGTLWFGYNGGILSYDGDVVEKISYPDEYSKGLAYCLYVNNQDDLFVFTSLVLLRYRGSKWEVIEENDGQVSFPNDRPLMAKNSYGLTVLATPSGLYELRGDSLKLVGGIQESVASLTFDKEENLWFVSGQGTVLNKISTTRGIIHEDFRLKQYQFDHETGLWMQILYNEFSDELIVHSWRPDVPAYRYNKESDSFVEETINAFSSASHMGSMSVGSNGLVFFLKTAMLSYYKEQWTLHDSNNQKLPINGTFSIKRRSGNVIVGGRGEPIYEIDYANQRWDSFMGLNFQCEDRNGKLWFISLEGAVVEYDPDTKAAVQHLTNVIDLPLTVICSSDGVIWAAGAHDGVAAVSRFDGQTWIRDFHPPLKDHISYLSALELSSGDLAFGGGFEFPPKTGGMVIYRNVDGNYTFSYVLDPQVPSRIVGLAQTSPTELWFGGNELARSTLPGFENTDLIEDLNALWYDHISADEDGGLWVGTWERGLFHFKDDTWSHYGGGEGLKSEQVVYVLNDNARPHTTWVATRMGLSRFENGSWINDVLPSDFQFARESVTLRQSSDGSIWINSANRDWYYRKSSVSFKGSNLESQFKTIRYIPDTQPPVAHFLDYETKVTKPANIYISWEGADVWSVTSEDKLAYSYRLNNEPWSPFSSENSVILTDLSKGDHEFQLRIRDLDGNESLIAQPATFTVVSPLWQRNWFILCMLSILITIIVLVLLLISQRVQNILRLEEFKLQFFTNLSHELRTPLSLILGPLDQLASKLPKSVDTGPLDIARRNAKKLLHLVEQILEFRRAEEGKILLDPAYSDLIELAKTSIRQVEPLSLEKNQKVYLVTQLTSYRAWFYPDTIERTLDNLILNAIKYTEPGGEISIKISVDEGPSQGATVLASISVEDNGIGIPEDKIPYIFDPFYRVSDSTDRVKGSGLGLALTKSFVESAGGRIQVESPVRIVGGEAKGTRFLVTIPLMKRAPNEVQSGEASAGIDTKLLSSSGMVDEEAGDIIDNEDYRTTLLLVEDDADMRSYLRSELREEYRILEAVDGNAALIIASKEVPDLILCDVMMPEMDGLALCQHIKSDEITSHIPVFMLTALNSSHHRLNSLGKGADAFFTKPVNIPILKQQIRNTFDHKAKIHERYEQLANRSAIDADQITDNTIDESFLNRSMQIIEDHIKDPLFDMEAFAAMMHVSRMTLYRKFKALTGESPSHFVRRLRMKKAAQLLQSGNLHVSEVSDLVGMQDVTYFSTAFKKHYKVTPSEFIAKSKKAPMGE